MKPKNLLQSNGETMHKKKFSKPLMERRRRARINDSLNELKVLVLRSLKKDPSRYSKMEKADILELTVKYLKALCGTSKPVEPDADHLSHFVTGYNECAREVQLYLLRSADLSPHVKAQMLSKISTSTTEPHTAITLSTMENPPMMTSPVIPSPIEQSNNLARSSTLLHTPLTSTNKSVSMSNSSPKSAFSFSFPSPPASPIIPEQSNRASENDTSPFVQYIARNGLKHHSNISDSHSCPNFPIEERAMKSLYLRENHESRNSDGCISCPTYAKSTWKAPSRATATCRKELWRPW